MNHIVEGLGAINSTPSGGFAKTTIKVKLAKLLRKEGDQNQTSVVMIVPRRGIYRNAML
jgi:hypothetical protein